VSTLPTIEITGPAIIGRKKDEVVFWSLRAKVQDFTLEAVDPRKNVVQEDRIHPMRTLLLDPDPTKIAEHTARVARLLSMHVTAGGSDQQLAVDIAKKPSKDFVTSGQQHVIAEPILDDGHQWPEVGDPAIIVPRFRLVAGTIELTGKANDFKWLGDSIIKLADGKQLRIVLTPDGFEVDLELPFPGAANALDGHVLVYPTAKGPRMRLIAEHLSNSGEWLSAWRAIMPNGDEAGEVVTGLKVAARRDGLPPAFVWTPSVTNGRIAGFDPAVEVPTSDLDVRLLSPRGPNGVDGVVMVAPDSYRIAPFDDKVVPDSAKKAVAKEWPQGSRPAVILVAQQQQQSTATPPETQIEINASADHSTVSLVPITGGHRCAHDEVALAAALRAAYGLGDLAVGTADAKRPLLSAFVPLDDGWLQLPVPNLPPPDPKTDVDILPVVKTPPNVLSGYLRFAQSGSLPPLLSAFPKEGPVKLEIDQAPWIITIEGARELDVVIGLNGSPQGGTLTGAVTVLVGPELSTRGLIWVSSDRPDVYEALPRIGAGAGQYLDIPLETLDIERPPAAQLTIASFELTAKKDSVTRGNLSVAFGFLTTARAWERLFPGGQKALDSARKAIGEVAAPALPLPGIIWQRHPRMPLASSMPMTRGAGSSVQPIESRDLVPFILERFPTMQWQGDAVFPVAGDFGKRHPIPTWPWPVLAKEERPGGIAMTAFGVPGTEATFDSPATGADGDTDAKWKKLRFANRFDLPVLDEAFATATLPPIPPDQKLDEERDLPPKEPVPLAYDWPAMKHFWDEQNRRHQLARVAHSHLGDFRDAGVTTLPIDDLVGGLTWSAPLGFTPPDNDPLPYGTTTVGADPARSGNAALLGMSGRFKRDGNTLIQIAANDPDPNAFDVTGYAPASFMEDGFLMDSRRSGTKQLQKISDNKFLWRPVRIAGGEVGLATLLQPVSVDGLFLFWFKDLPVKTGALITPPDGIEFAAWQDGHLPLAGMEWRLISKTDANGVFAEGRDRIPLSGFRLEPLRLLSCTFAMNELEVPKRIESVQIRARLYLGPVPRGAQPDGNLVTIALSRNGDGLKIDSINGPVRFALHAGQRRVVVSGDATWNGKLTVSNAAVTVSMFGGDYQFTPAVVSENAGVVSITWDGPGNSKLASGAGKLAVDHIGVTVKGDVVTCTVRQRILLTPCARSRALAGDHDAAVQIGIEDDVVTSAMLAGLAVTPSTKSFAENDGAFTATITAPGVDGRILLGFPVHGDLSLGVMARLGALADGAFELTAGMLDGELLSDANGQQVQLRRIAFHADRNRRDDPAGQWIGAIRFYGSLNVANAIDWPGIKHAGEPEAIPVAGVDKNGRRLIEIDAAAPATAHSVRYLLDGHGLSFDLAAGVLASDPDALWTLPVVATHRLQRDGDAAAHLFTAVETIAIGSAEAIVPRLDNDHPLQEDRIAFAARHRELVDKGTPAGRAPGMIAGGSGRIAVVLRGALGLPFRQTFWQSAHEGLFLAGGFTGLVGADDGATAPLLRLPVLMAFDQGEGMATPRVLQQNGVATLAVAWADGRAAREVVATLRSAVTPASASELSLRTALLAGSRRLAALGVGVDDTVAALLVEQSFAVNSDALTAGPLVSTPFFAAAAVSLARAFPHIPAEDDDAAPVLSLLAGHGPGRKGQSPRTLAAAMVTRSLNEPAITERRVEVPPKLATLGDDVVIRDWTGPAVADAGESLPTALIAGPATIDHVRPRAAMLRTLDGDKPSRYDAPSLPKPPDRARASAVSSKRDFADARRGYGLAFDSAQVERWLVAPEEGTMKPFRDANPPEAVSIDVSGLAGLSRTMSMPAHASNDAQVWVAQTRAPIYLSLPFPDGSGADEPVKSPPIPWLAPGAPRPRIPADDAVKSALGDGTQPILPERATVASVGDRAGISLARIARFERLLGNDFAAFDDLHARFGRPAQGGAWSARTERTPRPGALPENKGREAFDRRPCATPLLTGIPLNALKGPADTISGEANDDVKLGAWSVTFVAASEWNGMITESWDGTIRLQAEIDVQLRNNDNVGSATETLYRVLFAPQNEQTGDPAELKTHAELVIGDVVLPYFRMHVEDEVPFGTPFDLFQDVRRGVVSLVLDLRDGAEATTRGTAHPAIAAAFASAVLPRVELRLVVHPDTRKRRETFITPASSRLTIEDAPLAAGAARAPVTLRMPLAPVQRSRGALPLAPASLVFTDPAYNAALASAPVEHRAAIQPPAVTLPESRGALFAVLYADRGRVNRKGSITFMLDVAFERRLADFAGLQVPDSVNGDIVETTTGSFEIVVEVVAKSGARRTLFIAKPAPQPVPGFKNPPQPKIELGNVYELSLSSLVEKDGTLAALVAGDMLEVTVSEGAQVGVNLVGLSPAQPIGVPKLHSKTVTRTLRIILTDEPVVEPPPALYAALVRRGDGGDARLSLPLYAQSPLPWRVDLRDARNDFRRGLMRRRANFVWSLTRPRTERDRLGIHVVKVDRNGQTYLPPKEDIEKKFVKPRKPGS
jgi:hypothetical protein